jgi:hypothetical protein
MNDREQIGATQDLRVGIEHELVVWRRIHNATAGPFLVFIGCDEGSRTGPVVSRISPPLLPDFIMAVGTGQHVAIGFGIRDRASMIQKNCRRSFLLDGPEDTDE